MIINSQHRNKKQEKVKQYFKLWSVDNFLLNRTRGNHTIKVLWYLLVCRNSNAETFRSSNDRSNINDSVNHSVSKELLKNPVFMECTQPIGAPQKYICVDALCLAVVSRLPDWLRSSLRETFFTTLFPLASDNVPVTQWLDAMWELWGGLLLVVVGSLCGVRLCVYVRYWTVAPSLLNKENHSPFQQCFL